LEKPLIWPSDASILRVGKGLREENARLREENTGLHGQIVAVRASEERYKALYDALPVSLEVVDRDGIIVGVNPFHLRNMGKGRTTEDDYRGRPIALRPSIVAAGLSEKMTRVLEGEPFFAD
jgi:PAS domain-containing protein